MTRSSALTSALSAGLALALLPAMAQTIYPDDRLLTLGNQAYQARDCLRASRYLFAYQQRDPAVLRQDAALRANLIQAIEACDAYLAAGPGAGTDAKVDSLTGAAAGAGPAPKPLPGLTLQPGQGPSAIHGRCDIYASIAVAQQQANRAQSCALQGPMWNSGYRYHYDWCLGAPEADRRAGTAARQALLDRCRP